MEWIDANWFFPLKDRVSGKGEEHNNGRVDIFYVLGF